MSASIITNVRIFDGTGAPAAPGEVKVEEHVFHVVHNARVLLDHGFTSAFSGGATRPGIEVRLRDEIAAGDVPGPRLRALLQQRDRLTLIMQEGRLHKHVEA